MNGLRVPSARLILGIVASIVIVVLLIVPHPAGAATTGPAAPSGDRITLFDAQLALRPDGTLRVDEAIDYDFGAQQRHGIFVQVRRRADWASDQDEYRSWLVSDIGASSDGRTAPYTVQDSGEQLVIKVGDPQVTTTGLHHYRLGFTVDGAVLRYGGADARDELAWEVVGTNWAMPIDQLRVRTSAPFPVRGTTCTLGPPEGGTPCASEVGGFTATGLGPNQRVAVTLTAAPGSVTSPGPILGLRRDAGYFAGLRGDGLPAGLAILLCPVALVVAAVWMHRAGRDRRAPGGQGPGSPAPADAPPPGIGPGLIRPLISKRVTTRDVAATIMDLAARGYLTLQDTGNGDWRVSLRRRPGRTLRPYERHLLGGLFTEQNAVTLGELGTDLGRIRRQAVAGINAELAAGGWFRRGPDHTRRVSRVVGAVIVLAGLLLGGLLAGSVHAGILALPVVLAGFVPIVAARRAPCRTAAGAAARSQAIAFRRYLRAQHTVPAGEAGQPKRFARYLPYATALGLARPWVAAFAGAGVLGRPSAGWDCDPGCLGVQVGEFVSAVDGPSRSPAAAGFGYYGSDGNHGSAGGSFSSGSYSGSGGSSGGGSW
jgi:hypothetical protein